MKKKKFKRSKVISLRFFWVACMFILALLVFVFIADEMVLENENFLDKIVFQNIRSITSASITRLMVFVSFFGSSAFLLPAYILLIAYFLFIRKNRQLSLNVAIVGVTSTVILFSLKDIFHRHRPLHPLILHINGFSFPSGHSFSSFTFFGLLIYIIWNRKMNAVFRWILTVTFFLFACAIAFSRVYLHVHYASDVVAGFCLCIVWLGASLWLLNKLEKKLTA